MGDRNVDADGNAIFEDLTYNRKACIIFSTYKKSGFFRKKESGKKDEYFGSIFECPPITDFSTKALYNKHDLSVRELKDVKDVGKQICEIQGNWLKKLMIDGKEYWNIDQTKPMRPLPQEDGVLDSDWRYREDLIWLRYGY